MAGPLTCPKCGVNVVMASSKPVITFNVYEEKNFFMTWDDGMWKVTRTICLNEMTAVELKELLEMKLP
jgi:hypothetical protein